MAVTLASASLPLPPPPHSAVPWQEARPSQGTCPWNVGRARVGH